MPDARSVCVLRNSEVEDTAVVGSEARSYHGGECARALNAYHVNRLTEVACSRSRAERTPSRTRWPSGTSRLRSRLIVRLPSRERRFPRRSMSADRPALPDGSRLTVMVGHAPRMLTRARVSLEILARPQVPEPLERHTDRGIVDPEFVKRWERDFAAVDRDDLRRHVPDCRRAAVLHFCFVSPSRSVSVVASTYRRREPSSHNRSIG
jgi:hypothetical protein